MRTLALLTLVALSGCIAEDNQDVSTLHRSSFGNNEILSIATFDSGRGEAYNAENCQIVRDLMSSQPGVTATYWCTKGPGDRSALD